MYILDIEKKLRNTIIWSKNDISSILAANNPTIGNEYDFQDFVFIALKAGNFNPIDFPKYGANPKNHNYTFYRDEIVKWAKARKFNLPSWITDEPPKEKEDWKQETYIKMIAALIKIIFTTCPASLRKQSYIVDYVQQEFPELASIPRTMIDGVLSQAKSLVKIL